MFLIFEDPLDSFAPNAPKEGSDKFIQSSYFSFLNGWSTSVEDRRVEGSFGSAVDQPKEDKIIFQKTAA